MYSLCRITVLIADVPPASRPFLSLDDYEGTNSLWAALEQLIAPIVIQTFLQRRLIHSVPGGWIVNGPAVRNVFLIGAY